MNKSSLKTKALSSIGWSGSIQIASQILNFLLGIVLARMLTPDMFGLVAMLLVFTFISELLSDFGFSASLIQKSEVTKDEAFSCFIINCLIGLSFTCCLSLFNYQLADFYNEPFLEILALAIAPIFLINGTCSVPSALLSRELEYKKISIIQLIAVVLGSISAIVCAFFEFGVWSLIIQQYVTSTLRATLLLYSSSFRVGRFSLLVLKPLMKFSASVFTTKLIQQVAQQTDKVLVGKFLGASTLGYYSRAYYLTAFPITNITRVVTNVMFPVLSRIKDDLSKVNEVYFRLVGMIAILTFPVLMGMAFLAENIILVLLGEKWLSMTQFFIFFSIANIFSTIGQLCGPFFLSQGRADLQLKINFFTQPVRILLLALGVHWGVKGIFLAYMVSTFLSFLTPLLVLTKVVLKSNVISVFAKLFKPFFASMSMLLILVLFNYIWPVENPFYLIVVHSITGLFIYTLALTLLNDSSYFELRGMFLAKINARR